MSRASLLAVVSGGMRQTLAATPALLALAQLYDLEVLAHRASLDLLLGLPGVRLIYPYRGNLLYRLGLGLRLEKNPFQYLVVLAAGPEMLKLVRYLKFDSGINSLGWRDPKLHLEHLEQDPGRSLVEQGLALAAWAGAPPLIREPRLLLDKPDLAAGEQWLVENGLKPGPPRVALAPHPAWPQADFNALAQELAGQGAQVYSLGDKKGPQLTGRPAARGLPLRQAGALLALSDLLVGPDSGPALLAQAVGCPSLVLPGPGPLASPSGPQRLILEPPAPGQAHLEVATVLAAAQSLLASGRAGRIGSS